MSVVFFLFFSSGSTEVFLIGLILISELIQFTICCTFAIYSYFFSSRMKTNVENSLYVIGFQ